MNRKIEIIGGNELFGTIKNQTSKNASLPILSATLLCDDEVKINELPKITDVNNMLNILKQIGTYVKIEGSSATINPKTATNTSFDCELSKSMRSSLFLLGPMLNRFKEVDLTFPGGCRIGERPIDIHINAFKRLGVDVETFDEHILFRVKKFKPSKIKLKIPSVGATENIIQFACKQKGKTIIENAAREPEVVDLCNFLNQMGAKILGAGTSKITIYGVDKLCYTEYTPIGDRIVAGTIMCAVAICGGEVTITRAMPYQNLKLIKILQQIGCQIDYKNDIIRIVSNKNLLAVNKIKTGFYPDFATDLQSFILSVACLSKGKTTITENIFENRFLTVDELKKMGAKIIVKNNKTAIINGVDALFGATVKAKDLRGGASLVVAGLAGFGTTVVENIEFIDRGYENIEDIFARLGANIRRV